MIKNECHRFSSQTFARLRILLFSYLSYIRPLTTLHSSPSHLSKWFSLIKRLMLPHTFSTKTMLKLMIPTNTASVCFIFLVLRRMTLSTFTVIGRDLEYFSQAGFDMERIQIKRNAPVALLYEDAIRNEGAIISSSGALINFSGKKTGRSPKDKRIVYEETSKDDIWWGSVNIKMDERKPSLSLWLTDRSNLIISDTFEINRERAIDYLNTRENVYVFDGYAGVNFYISSSSQAFLISRVVGS